MLPLTMFRDTAQGVADLLNWAALVEDGVVLGKDGSLLAGYFYQGQDIASATDEERNYLTARVNAALSRFGSGWATWHDAVRLPAAQYPHPEVSHFPDPVTRLIDAERRQQFEHEGAHYETLYAFFVMYTPPLRQATKLVDLFYDHPDTPTPDAVGDRILTQFQRALTDLEDALGDVMTLQRMRGASVRDALGRPRHQDDLINYLHFALTGLYHPINVPADGMYLDAVLSDQELFPGDTPRIGEHFLCSVSIEGFPHESYPNILAILESLPAAYRWSTRMLYLDPHEATAELQRYRRKWRQKMRGFWRQVFRVQGGYVNEDALLMAQEAEAALTDANSALVTFGYYTSVVVLWGEDREALLEDARAIVREVRRDGFSCRIETINTVEAWLGTLPGHPLPNIRRPMIHTLHLADLLPLSSVWAGHASNPSPLFPAQSPPLMHTATTGATPFRLNLHVGDVGHTLVFGPTGAGKSTLLAMLAAQFRRYPGASVVAFEKGRSLWALANACGGQHVDVGVSGAGSGLAPLAVLETDTDMIWAAEWLASCYELQTQAPPTPRQREDLHRALTLLRTEQATHERSLTDLCYTLQDPDLRAALRFYTLEGPAGHLLDGRSDRLSASSFTVFELEDLMAMGDKTALPVLLTLFRWFERHLTGQPALLLLDEAWVMLGHPVFREKIREWLKTLRKANTAVVIATQSLSDAVRSGIYDVLIESCPTKILLPNEEADKSGTGAHPGPLELYRMMGLNDAQIRLLKTATKKRHYYYVSPEGRRLFDLGLGPVALAFAGVSDRDTLRHLAQLQASYGEQWPAVWLRECGVALS